MRTSIEVHGLLEWSVFLVSIVPFIELRGAIPLAIAVGYSPEFAFLVCVLVNMLVIPIAFILLDFILPPIRRRVRLVERMFKWSARRVEKHQNMSLVGLALFSGVIGAYTGSLIAYIVGWDRKRASLAIAAGIVIAGVLIWILATLGIIFIRGVSPY
jgi:uncharacterized membrane protein